MYTYLLYGHLMYLKIVSDIHLESEPLYRVPDATDDEILIIAGDLAPLEYVLDPDAKDDDIIKTTKEHIIDFLHDVSKNYTKVLYVPGNHEYYHGNINTIDERFKKFIHDRGLGNIHYLNEDYIKINGYKFIGTTLWTNVDNPVDQVMTYRSLADYSAIYLDDDYEQTITPLITSSIHEKQLRFIKNNIDGENTIVITHHSPSYKSVVEKYRGDSLNPFFHTELHDVIMQTKPKMWIHGHIHDKKDYMIGRTRIYCNPKGYYNPYAYSEPENPYYTDELCIKI